MSSRTRFAAQSFGLVPKRLFDSMKSKPRRRRADGFTLIELLVTLAILGVLATMTVPLAKVEHQRNQEQELRAALKEIRLALDAYQRASNDGRVPKSIGGSGYC